MATNKNKIVQTKTISKTPIPLKWNVSENIIPRFASNIVAQLLENEFKISFFEISPDIEEALGHITPKEIPANCVASIIVSADKLPAFIEVLQRQYNTYQKLKSSSNLPTIANEP